MNQKCQPVNFLQHQRSRFVIARNSWSALYIVKNVREGRAKEKDTLFLTRDEALRKRNQMRSIHHAAYQVFEVDWKKVYV